MQQSKWQIVLGFLLIVILLGVGYFIFSVVFRVLGSLDQPLIVAILAAAAAVITSTITVVVGRIFERKKEIESHFRQRKYDQYDELLKILYEMFDQASQADPSGDVIKRLREWQRKLILFAGPQTIRAFVLWMTNLKGGTPTVRTVFLMEDFFKALRADLGISNRGLEQGLLAHLILRHAGFMLEMAKKNTDLSLVELGKLEEALGLNKPYEAAPTSGESVSPASSLPSAGSDGKGI